MPDRQALDLTTCEREPIHVPGSIQPHGMLLVVDQANDSILQAAGDPSLLDQDGSLLVETVQQVLGVSLLDLLYQAEAVLIAEPIYLGTIGPLPGQGELTVTAHRVAGAAIIEVEPSGRPASAAGTLATIRSVTERISEASDMLDACRVAAREAKRITGYDRVLIYKFLADGSGSVIAEEKDDHLPTFLNHRYPASDIPKQARDLYRRNAIRIIPDVGYVPAPLMPVLSPTTNKPLDMSHCILRSVSPVHIRYLQNMGVGASMSVSLLQRGDLWGLIACHNTTAKFVPYETQEICRHLGQILSQQIRSREENDVFRSAHTLASARIKVLSALTDAEDPEAILVNLCPDLQAIVPSHGFALCGRETVVKAGHAPSDEQIRQLADWLVPRMSASEVFATDHLSEQYAEAAAFAAEASGLLSINLPGEDPTLLMWFRAEQIEEVKWAGNPHQPVEPGSSLGALNPRKSFATWRETKRGRSRPWEPSDIESVQLFAARAAFLLQQQRVRELNQSLREANDQLSMLATTDGLTGVANRRAFDERLEQEWARASRLGTSVALLIFDLDFFKQYNDHFGHQAGDDCLRQIAKVTSAGRRPVDLAARIGGEEFAVLLPDTSLEGATRVAETIRTLVEALHIDHPEGPMGIMTASFGVAALKPGRAESAQDLMQAADRALYEAKRKGRNQVAESDLPSEV